MANYSKFDASDYLTDEASIAAYLNEALEDSDPDVFLMAISTVARARGMSQIANESFPSITSSRLAMLSTILKSRILG